MRGSERARMNRHSLFSRLLACSILFLMAPALAAPGFDAEAVKTLAKRNVLLLVGPASVTKEQAAHYLDLVKRSGANVADYPVYQTAHLPNEVAGKLGLGKRGSNFGALVRWGDPARFGPAEVLEPGVVNELTTDADIYMLVENAIVANGGRALLEKLPPDLADLRPRVQLVLEQVDFQANGKPVYLVNTKVRVRNEGKVNAENVTVIFEVQDANGGWFELGRHDKLKVKAGNSITRDLVRPTFDTPLLNEKKEILPANYRIRIESSGGNLESTGHFEPKLIENQ